MMKNFKKYWADILIAFFILLILIGFALIFFGGNKNTSATQAPKETPPATTTPGNTSTTQAPSAAKEAIPTIPAKPKPQTKPETKPKHETSQKPATATPSTKTNPPAVVSITPKPLSSAKTPEPSGSKTNVRVGNNPAVTNVLKTPTPQISEAPSIHQFRISAGLYLTRAGAEKVAQTLRPLGYRTYVVPRADGKYVVLLGPFADRMAAEYALKKIQPTHSDLLIYSPKGVNVQPTTQATPVPITVQPTTVQPVAVQPTVVQPVASNSQVYLQVGAYQAAESAEAALGQLSSLGYAASSRVSADGLTRVLVGPFSEAEAQTMRSLLLSQGYESFTVR